MKSVKLLKKGKGKTALVRVDFNVPIKNKKIVDDFKISASLDTINYLLKNKWQVVLVSHLGRPEGIDMKYSLRPVAKYLQKIINKKVLLVRGLEKVKKSKASLILLENIRFDSREEKNSNALAKELSEIADVFVFEAMGVAHRKHSSTYSIIDYLPTYVGFRFQQELKELNKVKRGGKESVLIMGGAKVATKIALLKELLPKFKSVLIGGVLANNFLQAAGFEIGKSSYDKENISIAKKILTNKIVLPIDVAVSRQGKKIITAAANVKKQDKILDIGPETVSYYINIIKNTKLIVWNGPMGLIEDSKYQAGSYEIAMAIAASQAKQVVGGGDSMIIINDLQLRDYFSFISTGGGAMLKYLQAGKLPVMEKLKK